LAVRKAVSDRRVVVCDIRVLPIIELTCTRIVPLKMPESLGNRRNAINEKTRQVAGFKGFHGLYWLSVELEMVPNPES
jgi:hypothetical protein